MNNCRTVIFGFFLLSFPPSLASWQELPVEVKTQIISRTSVAENLLLWGLTDKANNKIMHAVLKKVGVQIKVSVITPDHANPENKFSYLHVTVDNCTIKTLQWINQFTNIKSLSLAGAGPNVRDVQLTCLFNLKEELKELNLSKTALNNQGFLRLENFSNLEILDVSDTDITDGCLYQVINYPGKLPNLQRIDIRNTKVDKYRMRDLLKEWSISRPRLEVVHNFS
jgi:hypothetical protein